MAAVLHSWTLGAIFSRAFHIAAASTALLLSSMCSSSSVNAPTITLIRGDTAEQHADVLVDAASSPSLGGGGVGGVIHRRG
ncbi:hypothetical protein ABT185_23820 [Streptomyces clavifer]|uniref:hypothetical protein n=1 Tax=Streptomyces clavifer TaxID=68188 RepID=UPI003319FBDA